MATSAFVPLMNIMYGLTIVSLLIIKFHRDYAYENGKASAEFEPMDAAFILDYSVLGALQANLQAATRNDDGSREKELLQFLCAMMILKVELEKFVYPMKKQHLFDDLEEDIRDNKIVKPVSGSMYASASNVDDDDTNVGWHRRYVSPKDEDVLKEASASMAVIETLCENYNPTKIFHILRKFGITFGSVEEMLQKEGNLWFITKKDLDFVNILLEITIGFPIQWKWVHKGRTVFPLVSVDKCIAYTPTPPEGFKM